MTTERTYTVTTRDGKVFTVTDSLTHAEAASAIRTSNKPQSDFALDLAAKADRLTSEKQIAWLHVLAGWATETPRPQKAEEGALPAVARMFASAIDAGKKRPRVHLALPSGDPVVLKSNGKGRANVTDGGPYGASKFFGSLGIEGGDFRPGRDLTDEVRVLLSALEADPEGVARQYGIATGFCCFCGLGLTDPRSLTQGYGPICAEKHGLPWGTVPEDADVVSEEVTR